MNVFKSLKGLTRHFRFGSAVMPICDPSNPPLVSNKQYDGLNVSHGKRQVLNGFNYSNIKDLGSDPIRSMLTTSRETGKALDKVSTLFGDNHFIPNGSYIKGDWKFGHGNTIGHSSKLINVKFGDKTEVGLSNYVTDSSFNGSAHFGDNTVLGSNNSIQGVAHFGDDCTIEGNYNIFSGDLIVSDRFIDASPQRDLKTQQPNLTIKGRLTAGDNLELKSALIKQGITCGKNALLTDVIVEGIAHIGPSSRLTGKTIFKVRSEIEGAQITGNDVSFAKESQFLFCRIYGGPNLGERSVLKHGTIYDGSSCKHIPEIPDACTLDGSTIKSSKAVKPILLGAVVENSFLQDPVFSENTCKFNVVKDSLFIAGHRKTISINNTTFVGSNKTNVDLEISSPVALKINTIPKPDHNVEVVIKNADIHGDDIPEYNGKIVFENCRFKDLSISQINSIERIVAPTAENKFSRKSKNSSKVLTQRNTSDLDQSNTTSPPQPFIQPGDPGINPDVLDGELEVEQQQNSNLNIKDPIEETFGIQHEDSNEMQM